MKLFAKKTINPYISDSQNMFNEKIKKRMIGISHLENLLPLELSGFLNLWYMFMKNSFASAMIFSRCTKTNFWSNSK